MAIGAAPLIGWNAVFHWIVLRNFTSSDYAARPIEASVEGFWESIGSLLAANTQFWTNPPSAWPWLYVGQLLFVVLMLFAIWQWLHGERAARVGCGMLLMLVATTAILYSKSRWGVSAGFSRYLIPMCFPLPILVGGGVAMLGRRSRTAAAALLVVTGPARNQRPPPLRRMGKAFARQRRATRSGRARTTRHHPRLCPRPHLAAADARLARAHHRLRLLRHPLRAVPRRRGRRLLGSDRHAQGAQDPFARGRQPLAARP